MAKPQVIINVEQRFDTYDKDNNPVHKYLVKSVVNTLDPRVYQTLSPDEIQGLINNGAKVNIK